MVTGRKSPTKTGTSPKNQTQDVRRNDLNNGSSSNSFEALAAAGDPEINTASLSDNGRFK